ncbi:hypothetical protein B0J13DRAFT_546265 [Dactylonectria estremocensis]|uniref:Uncharacterized protein n=1 Tax=Dactylonectria estremocensis TaxID=1079267 RepID=A0A9P9F8H1_9HYPO|nr:hypothetical protein B0J13DRAFT_546265 [Dactylonectria estremocensis]
MWLPTPSVESVTRPRLAVAIISAVAAASVGYYTYCNHTRRDDDVPEFNLHRSNAIRRTNRNRRNEAGSSSSSEAPGDENVDIDIDTVRPSGDGETIVEGGVDDWWNEPSGFPNQRAGHNIVNLLFRVSEDNARRNGCVHRGCQCNACGMVPIRGVRYRCANCADFDLCETCESQGVHTKTHIFYKIRMQPVWYTGDPDTCRRNLPRGLIPKLSRDTGFERPELEAFWEQWTFMANSEWRDDPDELGIAMDRKTFERCLVPTGGSRHAAPNLIHDRMFSFYDSNNDDLIGFTEFLHGLSYRKRKDKLRKIFAGYDIDGDGYVDRRDFLRMFRAYYVLYKQMHKDILDGLEDQLLASTEAQQLVTSRQPLSSLFGREGRVPEGDGGLRHEGKMYNRDGSIQITDGHESVVVEDRGDKANREDILTSLFACETDHRSRPRYFARSNTDTNWRTVRRLSGSEEARTYWVTLLEPPATIDELPGLLMGNHTLEIEEPSDDNEDEDQDRNGGQTNGINGAHNDDDQQTNGIPTESEVRARVISSNRQRAPKLEKRKRDMARKQLHERWRRRQFYLDEEEGGVEPDDWEHSEDILADLREMGESSKSAEEQSFSSKSSSSSKARLFDGVDDFEEPSGAEPFPKGGPGRWGLPEAEKDAGKEILYQVTQQAFNELLDTIFKPAEDLALQAAETKQHRENFKSSIDAIELVDIEDSGSMPPGGGTDSKIRSTEDKSLDDLLAETGYTLELPEGRNAVEIDTTVEIIHEDEPQEDPAESEADSEDYKDPTLPQFRPNIAEEIKDGEYEWYPVTNTTSTASDDDGSEADSEPATEIEPTTETLQQWKRLNIAEEKATKRRGWGKLSFDEFEAIYKGQEQQGNRLEYLGSWIDFCIP